MRAIVVGPAPTLEGQGRGTTIDSYDVVIKVHQTLRLPPEDYGSRCDWHYLSIHLTNYKPIFKHIPEDSKAVCSQDRIDFRAKLHEETSIVHPTSGLVCLRWALEKFTEVTLTGFTFYQGDGNIYGSAGNWHQNTCQYYVDLVASKRTKHRPLEELEYVKGLWQEGKVKVDPYIAALF